jgi:hypothetical protein
LTAFPKKPRRGRPSRVNRREVFGRALHYQALLDAVWDSLYPAILNARSAAGVARVLRALPQYYRDKLAFDPLPKVIFEAVQYKDFPKSGKRELVVSYLARSLAADGAVSHRRSRQICKEEQRANAQGSVTALAGDASHRGKMIEIPWGIDRT